MAADCLIILVTWFALPRRTVRSSPNTFAYVLLYDGESLIMWVSVLD